MQGQGSVYEFREVDDEKSIHDTIDISIQRGRGRGRRRRKRWEMG